MQEMILRLADSHGCVALYRKQYGGRGPSPATTNMAKEGTETSVRRARTMASLGHLRGNATRPAIEIGRRLDLCVPATQTGIPPVPQVLTTIPKERLCIRITRASIASGSTAMDLSAGAGSIRHVQKEQGRVLQWYGGGPNPTVTVVSTISLC